MRDIRIGIGTLIALLLLVAGLSQAQLASPVHVIPVVAKAAGLGGTDWRSNLSISNLATNATDVGINFYREETSNSLSMTFDKVVTLQGGETLLVEDVIGTWFPAEGNTKGALLIVALDAMKASDQDPLLAVSSRTFNAANPNATYGQTVPAAQFALLVGPGRIVMPGAGEDSRFRSNVGVFNFGIQDTEVVITVYDSTGNVAAEGTKTVGSLSMGQWSLRSLGVSSLTGGGRVDVRLADSSLPSDPCQYEIDFGLPTGVIMAYLSKTDNATSDSEFVMGLVDWSAYEAECGTNPDGCR